MYKTLYKSILILLVITISIILYLSTVGIKTLRFNQTILDKISQTNPNLGADLKEVYLKLNLKDGEIKINTKDAILYYNKNPLDLNEININLNLFSIFKENKKIKNLEISIKKNSIKEVINFLKTRKLNIPLLMIENSIKGGEVELKGIFQFDETNGKIKNYT